KYVPWTFLHLLVKPSQHFFSYNYREKLCCTNIEADSIMDPSETLRYETTGIRPEYLRDALPLRQVQRKIQDFLCNGEPIWKIRPRGGKARILVGHGLDHDLKCLELEYPVVKISYDIQIGIQDPYDDCVATMRLYRRMRFQAHRNENYPLATDPQNKNNFASWRQSELERMSPDELLAISRSDYYCWCLDNKD
ncbi:Ribonuclease H-like domain-containing protein, partial [Cynara cardunculus var. scolymus]